MRCWVAKSTRLWKIVSRSWEMGFHRCCEAGANAPGRHAAPAQLHACMGTSSCPLGMCTPMRETGQGELRPCKPGRSGPWQQRCICCLTCHKPHCLERSRPTLPPPCFRTQLSRNPLCLCHTSHPEAMIVNIRGTSAQAKLNNCICAEQHVYEREYTTALLYLIVTFGSFWLPLPLPGVP